MKKFLSILMAMCMVFALATTAFAADANTASTQEETGDGSDFNLIIDYWNTSEQVYVINGIEFTVLASTPTRGKVDAYKTVRLRDIYNDAILGDVYVYATCVYDGTYVSASSYGSYISYKPTSSDLAVTGTSISGNGEKKLYVTSSVSYTGSTGTSGTGGVTLMVTGSGSYY